MLFIYLFLSVLGLRCCGAFLSCGGGRGKLLSCGGGQASHCCGFSCRKARALGYVGFSSYDSQALEHRLNKLYSSCPGETGNVLRIYFAFSFSSLYTKEHHLEECKSGVTVKLEMKED